MVNCSGKICVFAVLCLSLACCLSFAQLDPHEVLECLSGRPQEADGRNPGQTDRPNVSLEELLNDIPLKNQESIEQTALALEGLTKGLSENCRDRLEALIRDKSKDFNSNRPLKTDAKKGEESRSKQPFRPKSTLKSSPRRKGGRILDTYTSSNDPEPDDYDADDEKSYADSIGSASSSDSEKFATGREMMFNMDQ